MRLCAFFAGLMLTVASSGPILADDADTIGRTLPTMGGAGGGLISDQQEQAIGQQVMRSLRHSARQINDPLLTDYLSTIVHQLLPQAALEDRNVSLVIIDSPQLNAFAVPGNIIGVNGGLFLDAETEGEFGSVMAHELGHLVQRHFARRLEQQQKSTPLTIAGMVAGIILSAVTKSDLGLATIAGTQALSIQNMLQYSRANEREADRVGIDILARSDMNPRDMPRMFETMMRQNRFQGGEQLEYLSTHPLSQNRVADTRNRANQYPEKDYPESLEFHLMRARVQVHFAESSEKAAEIFQAFIKEHKDQPRSAARYGNAIALLAQGKAKQAESILRGLLADNQGRITYEVTLAQALLAQKREGEAIDLMNTALHRNPDNYPITCQLAAAEYEGGNFQRAAELYERLTKEHPEHAFLWQKLADAEGQARNIVGVHRARAEYDILMGDLEAAERQLREAQDKVQIGRPVRAIINQRLSQVSEALAERRR